MLSYTCISFYLKYDIFRVTKSCFYIYKRIGTYTQIIAMEYLMLQDHAQTCLSVHI